MAWTAMLEGEEGEIIRCFPQELTFSVPPESVDIHFRLLPYLDPFGDTTFNQLMLDDLLADLRHFQRLYPQDALPALIKFIEACRGKPNMYVKFYGS